jgi:hypothetical protein
VQVDSPSLTFEKNYHDRQSPNTTNQHFAANDRETTGKNKSKKSKRLKQLLRLSKYDGADSMTTAEDFDMLLHDIIFNLTTFRVD